MNNSFSESYTYTEEHSSVFQEGEQRTEYIHRYHFKDYLKKYQLNAKDVELRFCPPVDEVCIYIKGTWSGYFDNDLIERLEDNDTQ